MHFRVGASSVVERQGFCYKTLREVQFDSVRPPPPGLLRVRGPRIAGKQGVLNGIRMFALFLRRIRGVIPSSRKLGCANDGGDISYRFSR